MGWDASLLKNDFKKSTNIKKYIKTTIFVIHRSSTRNHNKSYGFENNNKYRQKPKTQEKRSRRNCLSHLNNKLFNENILYDALNVCSKQTRTVSIMLML